MAFLPDDLCLPICYCVGIVIPLLASCLGIDLEDCKRQGYDTTLSIGLTISGVAMYEDIRYNHGTWGTPIAWVGCHMDDVPRDMKILYPVKEEVDQFLLGQHSSEHCH